MKLLLNLLSKLLSALILLAFVSVVNAQNSRADEAAIRACFKNYQAAIAKKDGNAAATLVSNTSIKYYGGILNLALNADEAKLRQVDFYRKMMALLVRNEAPDIYSQLGNSTNASRFFALVVSNGWGGEIGSPTLELGKINKQADIIASAPAVLNGQETPARFVFEFERDGWKFSLLDVIVRVNQIMKEKQKSSSVGEEDAIIQSLEKRSGRPVSKDIWKPLNRK